MIPKAITLVVTLALVLGVAHAGSGRLDKKSRDLIAPEYLFDKSDVKFTPPSPPDPSTLSLVGNSTTITGFWDFQLNGGGCEMIRVNPANGNIHVIMMIAEDSTDAATQSSSRRTAYAMSTNNGVTWDNFGNLRVPGRRSGYPFLDLGKGPIAGAAIVANHSVITTVLQSTIFIDDPEGSGAFAEIGPPSLIEASGADEPVWAAMACASDGSVIMAPGRLTAATSHITRTADYISWSPWVQFPGSDQGSARNVVVSNETGRIAVMQNSAGVSLLESTNNGATWPASPLAIFPSPSYTVGTDTTQYTSGNGSDVVYNGNNVLAVTEAVGVSTTNDEAQIHFWSAATGIKLVVPHDSRFIPALNVAQVFQSTLGYPVIGMSGTTIVVVFAAFQSDVSSAGFNYCDLWYTTSTNGGNSWTTAVNLTNTPAVDERFPSISKWNPPGFANIVWQEKLDPGSSVRTERPITRASQKFLRFALPSTGVGEDGNVANNYKLSQNFPNPFNPATTIDYSVAEAGFVTIRVYDLLGKEVATILAGNRQRGTYQATFDASSLPSGVYMYQMKAGSYSESRKLVLLK